MAGRIGGLGEIALRVNDLDRMQQFYQQVIGLELMNRQPRYAFFRIADGFAGHTQVLALFDRSATESYTPPDERCSTIDHLAFSISREDYALEKQRLEDLGLPVETARHAWVQWSSLFVRDPEGNLVELVCHDPDADA